MARGLQGSIRRRGEKWQVTVSTGRGADGRYHRRSFTCASEAEARDKLLELNLAKRRGELAAEQPGSLGQLLEDWVESLIRPHRALRTYTGYRETINRYLAGSPLMNVGVERVRPQDVQAFYGRLLAAGVPPDAVRRVHRILRAALATAVKWGHLQRNPVSGLTLPRHRAREVRVLSMPETSALVAALRETDPDAMPARAALWAPVAVAVTTGLRPGELLALRWADVDLEAATLTVRRAVEEVGRLRQLKDLKTSGSRRTIALHGDTVAVLRKHRQRQNTLRLRLGSLWEDEDLVFPLEAPAGERPAGRLRSPKAMSRVFTRTAAELGYAGLRMYDLRHTHATHLLSSNVPVKDVSARLGHASAAMTLGVYAHLLPGSQERAVEVLDGVIGEQST